MKKLISLVLALVLCVVAMPVMAFADTTSTDGLFGVILDADGNVVERIPMSKSIYVNSIHTLSPGGKFISYQYWAEETFLIGFSTRDMNDNYMPTSDLEILMEIWRSDTVGEDGKEYCGYWRNTIDASVQQAAWPYKYNIRKPGYYNGMITNEGSTPAKIRIIVARDITDEEFKKIYLNT